MFEMISRQLLRGRCLAMLSTAVLGFGLSADPRSVGPIPSSYVVDHTKALKHGGSDTPANMEWKTKEAAKAKDRTE